MPLDIYPDAQKGLTDYTAAQPGIGPGAPAPDIGTAFVAAANASAGSLATLRAWRNSENVVNEWLDAFAAQTGYRPDAFGGQLPGSFDYDALNKAYQTEKTAHPGFDLEPPPTPAQAWQAAMDIERGYAEDEARATGGQQTILSQFGTAAGAIAAFAADPITLASSAALSPEAGGIVMTAIRDAAVFGAQQAAVSAAGYPVSKGLNPDYGVGDVLYGALESGLEGAGLGLAGRLGARGIAAVWTRLKTGNWPQYVRDAGNVVTRQAVNDAGNPAPEAGPVAGAAYAKNAADAEAAVAAGKPVTATVPFEPPPVEAGPVDAVAARITAAETEAGRPLTPEEQVAIVRAAPELALLPEMPTSQVSPVEAATEAPEAVPAAGESSTPPQARTAPGEPATVPAEATSAPAPQTTAATSVPTPRVAAAYGNAPIVQQVLRAPELAPLAKALDDAAPTWTAMRAGVSRGTVPAQMDVTRDLASALDLINRAKQQGVPLADLVAQRGYADRITPATRALLSTMYRDDDLTKLAAPTKIARALKAYADAAIRGEEPALPPVAESLQRAPEVRPDLAAAVAKATAPEAVEKAAADAATDDATIHAADHLIADSEAPLMIPDPTGLIDAEGAPVMRPVRELLDEADAEISAAREIEGCVSGALGMPETA